VDPVPDPLLSENLVAPGIEPGTSGLAARNSGVLNQAYIKYKIKRKYFNRISL
jgi:hypothetical protein